MKAYPNIRKD